MKSETETLLLHDVQSRLRAAIPKMVPMVGADDIDELVQDGITIALHIQRSANKAGKKITGSSLAHYAVLSLRAGRRSTGFRTGDVHHPAAQLSGNVRLQSLDEPISEDEHGQTLTLHDCIAAPGDDPATAAARSLDWASVPLDRTKKAILVALAEGRELTLLVCKLRRSRSALQSDKERLGRLIREQLGNDILIEVQSRPVWTSAINAVRQRLACRAERRAA